MWFDFVLPDYYYSAHRPDDDGYGTDYRNGSHDYGTWPDNDYPGRRWRENGAQCRHGYSDMDVKTYLSVGRNGSQGEDRDDRG